LPALVKSDQDCLEPHPEPAGVMAFAVLRNSARQRSQNEELHRPRRLNLAKLNVNDAIFILQCTRSSDRSIV